MKTRLLSTLALISLIVLAFAAPASAQQPIPNINQTSEFRALKKYVGFLEAKRAVPANAETKTTYKLSLSAKRTAANNKSDALYNRRVLRISKQDDNKQRRQIKVIRQNQKVKTTQLKGELSDRLGSLQAKENAAVDRINNSYGARIQSLTNKRSILQKRLDKTTNAAKRDKITIKINAVQKQINTLVNAKQADLNVVTDKYNGKAANLNDLFAARIQRTKDSAASQIKQAKKAYKQLYRDQLAAAKAKKNSEISLITDQANRGTGFITEMPNI